MPVQMLYQTVSLGQESLVGYITTVLRLGRRMSCRSRYQKRHLPRSKILMICQATQQPRCECGNLSSYVSTVALCV